MSDKILNNFVDLHLHSTFSSLDGFGTPEQIVLRAKEIGRKSIALTDHGSVSGLVQLNKACKKNDIKPIYGCEFYMVESIPEMFENKQRNKFHITIIAENNEGYANLLKLSTESYNQGFYYRPTIDKKLLFEYNSGLIVLSGCWYGMMQEELKRGNIKDAQYIGDEFKNIFGDRYFLETQQYDVYKETSDSLKYISETLNIPMVLTCDPHYLKEDEYMIQHLLHCIRFNSNFGEGEIWDGGHQWPVESLYDFMKEHYSNLQVDSLFNNVSDIGIRCNVEMPIGAPPKYIPLPSDKGDNVKEILWNKCKQGIIDRNLKGSGDVYRERFNRELEIIIKKDFIDYFLIVADMVQYAKKNNIIVGPARGSSAGSLICYLLGITDVDPLKHSLIFERFIDENRDDLPDIDIDFDRDKRESVKEYLSERYGMDRVCNIATFAKFKGRNTLDDVGRVINMPKGDIEIMKKYIPSKLDSDDYSDTILDSFQYPEVKQIVQNNNNIAMAPKLEGQLRHMGKHAAGIIVGDRPLSEVIALYKRDNDKHFLGSVEMKDATQLGLLKIDVLGISELTLLHKICDMINMPLSELYQIPLDDEKTLEGFKKLDVGGIFQFDGYATKSVMRQLPHIDFEVLVACTALSRPGPNDSNSTQDYIDTANGVKINQTCFHTHPKLKEILSNTYSQIVYQEQALAIVKEVGNMSWLDANKVRVAISKKLGEQEINKYYPMFEQGCIENDLSKSDADMIWDNIKTMGQYAFNKSHAVSYTIISFVSMYMKQHYPLEFFAAMLMIEDDKDKVKRMINEIRARNIELLPPVLGKSRQGWIVENGKLRAGLLSVDGIGIKAADVLVNDNYLTREDIENKKNRCINKTVKNLLEKHNMYDDGDDNFFGLDDYVKIDRKMPNRSRFSMLDDGPADNVRIAFTVDKIKCKDIYEERRKKGQDSSNLKNPELAQYAIISATDDTDSGLLYIPREKWPNMREIFDAAKKGNNTLVAKGQKINNGRLVRIIEVKEYK